LTEITAKELLSRIENDQAFAAELDSLKGDPNAVLAKVHDSGFDVTPEEVRAAFLDRYGDQLNSKQLEAIAAGQEGMDDGEAWAIIGGATAMGIAVGAAAAVV
jgi:predicted ribosomally synthesized peptide with nif11-like leader